MAEDGTSAAAAWSAARLGGRTARRQVQAALAHAAEFGAYSVGFALERGGLAGFTVYFTGPSHAGCADGRRTCFNTAAKCAVQPSSRGHGMHGHAQPMARDAASRRQPWQQHPQHNVAEKRSAAFLPHCAEGAAPGAASAPATAAARRRGCRAGKRRSRRKEGGQLSAAAACAHSGSQLGRDFDAAVSVSASESESECIVSPAPIDLPKAPHPPSTLSHKAPSFTPSGHGPAPVVCPPPPVATPSSLVAPQSAPLVG